MSLFMDVGGEILDLNVKYFKIIKCQKSKSFLKLIKLLSLAALQIQPLSSLRPFVVPFHVCFDEQTC